VDKIVFVAMLVFASGCCFLVGAIDLVTRVEFATGGEHGVMRSSDPVIHRTVKHGVVGPLMTTVEYETAHRTIVVHGKYLAPHMVKRLGAGEGIPVTFLTHDPNRVQFNGEEPPVPWGWWVMAVLLAATSVYAHRLLRREVGLARG
jgi:hypothetical protein